MKGSGDGLHNSVNGSDTSELYADKMMHFMLRVFYHG